MIFILALVIIYISIFCIIRSEIANSTFTCMNKRYSFFVPVSFSLTMALVGLISNTSFYLDIPTEVNIYFVYVVAILFLPILLKRRSHLKIEINFSTLDISERIIIKNKSKLSMHDLFLILNYY